MKKNDDDGTAQPLTPLYKTLKPGETYFQFDRIPEYQIAGTVAELARQRGLKISEKAASVLVESLGVDLSAIDQELGKYAVVLGEGGEVTAATVEKYTGSSREYNQFELLRALVAHNPERSYDRSKHDEAQPFEPADLGHCHALRNVFQSSDLPRNGRPPQP